jgi:hypothetical protein
MTLEWIAAKAKEAGVPNEIVVHAMYQSKQLVSGFTDDSYWHYYASVMCKFYRDGFDETGFIRRPL